MSFRILTLDGGGIRGAITAKILEQVEQELDKQGKGKLADYFDLIAGTSTGSILTASIAVGKTTKDIINLYHEKGEDIFPKKTGWAKFSSQVTAMLTGGVNQLLAPAKYTHDGLIKVLQKELGNKRVKDIDQPIILILAYDTLYRNTTFFTNCHPDVGARWYDDCYLWQLCVASASAPTFFPPYKLEPVDKDKFGDWEFPHIDGGVAANNPALAALSLALRLTQSEFPIEIKQKYKLENLKIEDISILSIGTGQTNNPYDFNSVKKWKGKDWIQNLPDIFMDPTSEIGGTMCRHIMGGYNSPRYLRLQFDLNESFQAKPYETYKDARILLPLEKRLNKFSNVRIDNDMDNGDPEFVQTLINTTEKYLAEAQVYYTRNDDNTQKVSDAIKSFIANN